MRSFTIHISEEAEEELRKWAAVNKICGQLMPEFDPFHYLGLGCLHALEKGTQLIFIKSKEERDGIQKVSEDTEVQS